MSNIFLAHRTVSKTGKILATELGLKLRYGYPLSGDIIKVRWGVSGSNTDTLFNRADLIAIAANKKYFSDFCRENELPHLDYVKGIPNTYPVVVRTLLESCGGRGIIVCKNEAEFMPYKNNFWTQYVNFTFELGVHLLGGKIIKIMKKEREDVLPEEEFPIRNSDRGYHFKSMNVIKYMKLSDFINRLYEVFPINMGRVDIGWDGANKTYRLIEVNSAPGLADNIHTLTQYVTYLRKNLEMQHDSQ